MKISCTIDNKELQVMRQFIAEDEARFMLQSILFEVHKDRVLLIATNGRALVVLRSNIFAASGEGIFVVPASMLPAFDSLKERVDFDEDSDRFTYCPNEKLMIVFDDKTEMVSVGCSNFRVEAKVLNGDYPKWREILSVRKTLDRCERFSLNPEYLKPFEVAATILGDQNTGLIFRATAEDRAVEIHIAGFLNFLGVLMPMEISSNPAKWRRPHE